MQKKFETAILILILISAFAEISIAADWVQVASSDLSNVFVDVQSIKRTGQKVKVWTKWVYNKPFVVSGSESTKPVKVEKSLIVFLCDKRKFASLDTTQYAEQESPANVVSKVSHEDTPSLQYNDINPGSLGEITMDYVCKRISPKKSMSNKEQ